MWGIWAAWGLQGRETATSNYCPSFYLHAKDGKIVSFCLQVKIPVSSSARVSLVVVWHFLSFPVFWVKGWKLL